MGRQIGPFRVGDKPADALDLVVERPGDDDPLSGFSLAEVQMMRPDRTITTWPGALTAPNIVRSSFPSAFTQAGLHRIRARLTGANGAQEDLRWVRFWVRPA